MSLRAGGVAWLLAFEARLAWRRVAGERRRLALVAIVLFWVALHAPALSLAGRMAGSGSPGLLVPSLGLLALVMLLAAVAAAFGLAAQGLFERADLALVASSPVPATKAWAARTLALAASVVAFPAYFVLPFAHAAAWHGVPAALAAYPALAALAVASAALAMLATLALARFAGARRGRVLAQIAGAIAGAGLFLAFQARNLLPADTRAAFDRWLASEDGRGWTGEASPLWWPARAFWGDPAPLFAIVAFAAITFPLAVRQAARAQAAGWLEPLPAERGRGGEAPSPAFGGALARIVIAKEWRLVARDPRAILHLLLPLLYLLPLLVIAFREGDSRQLLAPSVVVLAGFLAGGLAWLAASAEEAPDLLASAPQGAGRLFRLKLAASAMPALAVASPFVAAGAFRSPFEALVMSVTLAGSVAGSALVQFFGAEPGARRDLARNAQPGRLVALVEHVGAAGWGGACWGALAGSAWGWAGLALGIGAPVLAFAMRPRPA